MAGLLIHAPLVSLYRVRQIGRLEKETGGPVETACPGSTELQQPQLDPTDTVEKLQGVGHATECERIFPTSGLPGVQSSSSATRGMDLEPVHHPPVSREGHVCFRSHTLNI
jgi:hypothetical protein